jgi:predicted tellurium resistance membrane protein TerC
MSWITSPEAWVGLLSLTVLEIVLGIDNIIFISILAADFRRSAGPGTTRGVAGSHAHTDCPARGARVDRPPHRAVFHRVRTRLLGSDLILIAGGLFLLTKSTREIHEGLEGDAGRANPKVRASFAAVVGQIMLLDIVFSLDSVITAVGMARHLPVMITAVVLAVGVMLFAAGPISDFVHRHPTIKMLALSFLLLIGVSLIADGLGQHIAKAYIYFAMGFSVFVEMLNIRMRARSAPVELREAVTAETPVARS